MVREAARLVQLDARLPKLLNGDGKPANAAECIEIAHFCQERKKLQLAAVRFFEEAFAATPGLLDDLRAANRYNAACATALAGCWQARIPTAGRQKIRRAAGQSLELAVG